MHTSSIHSGAAPPSPTLHNAQKLVHDRATGMGWRIFMEHYYFFIGEH